MLDSQIARRHPHIAQRIDDACQTLRDIRRILPSFHRVKDHGMIKSTFQISNQSSPVWDIQEASPLKRLKTVNSEPTDLGPSTMDGPADKKSCRARNAPVAAIFVHAGAGYHSTTNEHIHLNACSE
jgi:hypothetical protein